VAPIHNAIAYGTELQRAFYALVGLNEAEEGVVRLGETLTPVVDAWREGEWNLLRGERLGATFRNAPAVASERSGVAIANPAGSKVLVIVDRVRCSAQVADVVVRVETVIDEELVSTIGLLFSQNGFLRDVRDGREIARAIIRYGSSVVGIPWGTTHEAMSGRLDSVAISTPYILEPGRALVVLNSNVNQGVTVTFVWRERGVFPGELPPIP
jgi:hypothetical protein